MRKKYKIERELKDIIYELEDENIEKMTEENKQTKNKEGNLKIERKTFDV